MTSPLLSIIIPTYNGSHKLLNTLRALRACKHQELTEIIVVDDGSTDDTLSLLNSCKEELALIITTQKNGGPGSARNNGAKIATGEYLMFLGDDTTPSNNEFLATHLETHQKLANNSKAVLGKIVWPNNPGCHLSLTELLIQGEGQQQFGFAYMNPWEEYQWPFFYTSNISFHRSLVHDWEEGGFSSKFYLAAYEDGELAYRLSKVNPEFGIVYCPIAPVEHYHSYTFSRFISRQLNCGQMAEVMIKIHPELSNKILPSYLTDTFSKSVDDAREIVDKLITTIEGIRAFCEIYEQKNLLGSQNWHVDFVNASLDLFYAYGYVLSAPKIPNRGLALQAILDQWSNVINKCAQNEVFGPSTSFLASLK